MLSPAASARFWYTKLSPIWLAWPGASGSATSSPPTNRHPPGPAELYEYYGQTVSNVADAARKLVRA